MDFQGKDQKPEETYVRSFQSPWGGIHGNWRKQRYQAAWLQGVETAQTESELIKSAL